MLKHDQSIWETEKYTKAAIERAVGCGGSPLHQFSQLLVLLFGSNTCFIFVTERVCKFQ